MKKKILVVDDEKEIADLLQVYLENDGFEVYKYYTGKEALEDINNRAFDLAILDIMLPDVDGFTICKKIRETNYYPIIMLSAKVEAMDKIMGLTLGADDYITKPFHPLEMLARVKTQLRRYTRYNQEQIGKTVVDNHEFDIAGLIINKGTHKCTLYGELIALTPIEFDILWYLCERQGNVVPSDKLFESIWKEKYLNNNNTVMSHIARIREKLHEPPRKPRFIKTVWGVGYTIE